MRIILCGFGVVAQSLVKLFESREDETLFKIWIKTKIISSI